jgi:hypothetical protein
MNRQQRRATERAIRKLGTFDQHFASTLRDVRAEFERDGNIGAGFNCVTDSGVFSIPGTWDGDDEKAAAFAALRDSFRRRGQRQAAPALTARAQKEQ